MILTAHIWSRFPGGVEVPGSSPGRKLIILLDSVNWLSSKCKCTETRRFTQLKRNILTFYIHGYFGYNNQPSFLSSKISKIIRVIKIIIK